MAIDKNAKELIQKLAVSNNWIRGKAASGSQKASPARLSKAFATNAKGQERAFIKFEDAAPGKIQRAAEAVEKRDAAGAGMRAGQEKKSSDMRAMIDDLIKGAKENSFGRPVHIQNATQDWTPLKVAEYSGALVALSERGLTEKEAAEYLGLTVAQVQDIVRTVG
jgi:hypothetical protein